MKNINIEVMGKALNFLKVHGYVDAEQLMPILDTDKAMQVRVEALVEFARQYNDIPARDMMPLLYNNQATPKPVRDIAPSKKNKRWTENDMRLVADLKQRGVKSSEIAKTLWRTEPAINVLYSKMNTRDKYQHLLK